MKALELSLNGQRICTAGIGDVGFIIAQVLWDLGAESLPPEGHLELKVSGVDKSARARVDWPMPYVSVGDEITLTIVEAERVDAGKRRTMPDTGSQATDS